MITGCFQSRPSGPDLYTVKGTVTVDGAPLSLGVITFDPADGIAGSYGSEIRDGKYSFESAVGPKKVTILASRPSKTPGPDGLPGMEQYLPARYNMKSELTGQVQPQKQNDISFDLTTDQK